jgi:4-hydroxy-tetrahydrodipicolinate synthase
MLVGKFSGVIAYTVTPFTDYGEVNVSVLANVIDKLIDAGANAIAALGSAGECAYLDDDEWALVAEQSIKNVDKRLPIIIGISELTTHKAIQKVIFAEEKGADAVMVAPRAYYKLSEDEIYEHFSSISAAISIPIMVYSNPTTSGVEMSAEFMLSMVQGIEQICMIKESSTDINRINTIKRLCGDAAAVFTGCNYLALDALKVGVDGWCTAAPNLIDDGATRIVNAVNDNDLVLAEKLFEHYKILLKFMVKKGLARTVKAGLQLKGVAAGKPRKPLRALSDENTTRLAQLLAGLDE